jgi:phage-related protein
MAELDPIGLRFWATRTGNEPVRDFLGGLSAADKKKIGQDIRTVQFGWPLGMPLVRSIGKGLHELRTSLPSRREARIMFAVAGGELHLLHAFIKKSARTDHDDLELAIKRMKELKS